MIYQATVVDVIPGQWECDSAVLDDGDRVFQLCLLKSCAIADYIEKEVIINIDGDDIEITEISEQVETV